MDFYNIPIPTPPPEEFDNEENLIQLSQIETWNNDVMEVFWRPSTRQIIISIDDSWFVQPDTINIVTSLSTLFACEDYQIRIKELTIMSEIASPEDIWSVYISNWFYFASNTIHLQFRADVDYDTEQAPQWVDIVPDSQVYASIPEYN